MSENKIKVEFWKVNDPRLPKSNDIIRTMPDDAFIQSMREKQLQPILMVHDPKTDEWFIGFGRKRLLAMRKIAEDAKIWVRVEEGTHADADRWTLIENAQRSANEVGDYVTVKHILFNDPTATYKSIAKEIGKLESYVKNLDKKYATVPQWVLDGVLSEKIAETVAIAVGRLNPTEQKQCKEYYDDKKKLPSSTVSDIRRFVQQNAAATMSMAINNSVSSSRDFYGRSDLEDILKLLEEKKYPQAKAFVVELLSQ